MNRAHLVVVGLFLVIHSLGVTAGRAQSEKESLRSLQPQVAAPNQHRLRYENPYVRVFEVVIPPAGVAPLHLYDLVCVFITLSPARLRIRNAKGTVVRETSRAQITP